MALPFGAWWPAVPLMITTIGVPLINVAVNALIAELVPEDLMGRMDAVLTAIVSVFTPIAPVAGALLADTLGGAGALLVFGALMLVMAVVAALSDLRTPRRSSPASG